RVPPLRYQYYGGWRVVFKGVRPKKFRQISTPTLTRTIVLPVSARRGSPGSPRSEPNTRSPSTLVRPEPVFVRFIRTFVRSAQVFGRTCVWIPFGPWAGFGAEAARRGPRCRAPQVSQTPRGLRRLGRILYLYKPPHMWYYDSTGCVFLSPSRSP